MDITQIIVALIALLGTVITGVIIPMIKAKTTSQQWNNIVSWADTGVHAAEAIYKGAGRGDEKKEYVINFLKTKCEEKNVKIDFEDIENTLESSWFKMTNK